MSDDYWGLAKAASGGGGFAAVLLFGRWLVNWITGRHDRREARLDAKSQEVDQRWAAYTRRTEDRCAQLEERITRQEAEIEECHRSKRELESRVTRLEGIDLGLGERRQDDQLLRALESKIAGLEKKGGTA